MLLHSAQCGDRFSDFRGRDVSGNRDDFFLIFNGIYLGAAAGYVNHVGNPESFWTFVAGHSSPELLGMIVSGMAGMRLGLAIVRPGRLPRSKALTEAAKQALPLIYGAALMTTFAASIEGFWSALVLPSAVKYTVGVIGWALFILYFFLAGRKVGRAA
ncbi:MAG: hypothetical protein HC845_10445 [Akkermansiaceae bacterium]|nr:hypothetical protein [Akkermansiaceae bacterium]